MKTIILIVRGSYVSPHSGKDMSMHVATDLEVPEDLSLEVIEGRVSEEKWALLEEEFGTIDHGGAEDTLEFDLPDSGPDQEEATADICGLLEALVVAFNTEN